MKLTNLEIQTSHQAYPQAGEPGDPMDLEGMARGCFFAAACPVKEAEYR